MNRIYRAWVVVTEAGADWLEDKAAVQGAALAFYSILSIAPLLVISLVVASYFLDRDTARSGLVAQMDNLIGAEGAKAIESMLDNDRQNGTSRVSTAVGIVTLLFGASGVFGQLQEALNTIWEVKPKPGGGIWTLIRSRFLSLTMVLGTAFLLLVSLVLSAAITGLSDTAVGYFPGLESIMHVVTFLVTFALVTVLFALIFKYLPDAEVSWSDVWVGAIITALLFSIGKLLIGLYLGNSDVGSAYGAAGSLVVLVVWIYYSAQIMLFGAELTQVYARVFGSRIVPKPGAEPATQESRAQAGLAKKKK